MADVGKAREPIKSAPPPEPASWPMADGSLADFLARSPRGPQKHFPPNIHWFRGWGVRLRAMVQSDEWEPSRYDGMIFRPDQNAREAMIRFGGRYPQVIGQVREYLAHAEEVFADFLQLQPPIVCPTCGSGSDIVDTNGRQHCCECGTGILPPPQTPHEAEDAKAGLCDALMNLERVLSVAVDTIEKLEAPPDAPSSPAPSGAKVEQRGRAAPINARMLDTLMKRPESRAWSIQKWTTHLDCSRAAVHGTLAWRELMKARNAAGQAKLDQQTFPGRDGKRKPLT